MRPSIESFRARCHTSRPLGFRRLRHAVARHERSTRGVAERDARPSVHADPSDDRCPGSDGLGRCEARAAARSRGRHGSRLRRPRLVVRTAGPSTSFELDRERSAMPTRPRAASGALSASPFQQPPAARTRRRRESSSPRPRPGSAGDIRLRAPAGPPNTAVARAPSVRPRPDVRPVRLAFRLDDLIRCRPRSSPRSSRCGSGLPRRPFGSGPTWTR